MKIASASASHSDPRTIIKIGYRYSDKVASINCLTSIWPLPGNWTTDSSLALISLSLTGRTRTTTLILSSKGVELPDDLTPRSAESTLHDKHKKCITSRSAAERNLIVWQFIIMFLRGSHTNRSWLSLSCRPPQKFFLLRLTFRPHWKEKLLNCRFC